MKMTHKEPIDRRADLAARIKKSGKSIAKVARNADINHNTLYGFLQGKTDISLANYDKIIAAL